MIDFIIQSIISGVDLICLFLLGKGKTHIGNRLSLLSIALWWLFTFYMELWGFIAIDTVLTAIVIYNNIEDINPMDDTKDILEEILEAENLKEAKKIASDYLKDNY